MRFYSDTLTREQKYHRRRILEISWQQKLSHLGSCFSVIDILIAIYKVKRPLDEFVLSNGHAGVAWYTILEKQGLLPTKKIPSLYIHPDRKPEWGITVSTGSLGQGLPIAVGMALADRKKKVFCVISDGECAEGSIWEALRIAEEKNLTNLITIVNANGWAAYKYVELKKLKKQLKASGHLVLEVDGHDVGAVVAGLKVARHTDQPVILFARTTVEQLPFLKGQDAHYCVMSESEYHAAIEDLG